MAKRYMLKGNRPLSIPGWHATVAHPERSGYRISGTWGEKTEIMQWDNVPAAETGITKMGWMPIPGTDIWWRTRYREYLVTGPHVGGTVAPWDEWRAKQKEGQQ